MGLLFNSWVFAAFFVVVWVLHRPARVRWQNGVVLVASYIFYGWWDWRFLSLLAVSTLVDFSVARRMSSAAEAQRRGLLMVSLVTNLGILGFFKYFGFFVGSAAGALTTLGFEVDWSVLTIVLPVGISFYTFQTMAYTIDVYRRRLEPTSDFLAFAVYVSFFPQLVAGPIERAQRLLPQLTKARRATRSQLASGLVLILIGLARKIAIADVAAPAVDRVFADLSSATAIATLGGVLLFSLQIYADFAGYSDIARGTARMLGIDLMINFEHPYFSTNIADFWRRWHISLSTWLRDYLYIPLGGNRQGPVKTYRNLMLTMLLGGLWHGAAWTFVVWGGIHGFALAVHRRWKETREPRAKHGRTAATLGWLATMMVVVLAWVFFRAASLGDAVQGVLNIATMRGGLDLGSLDLLALFAVLAAVVLFIDIPQRRHMNHTQIMSWPTVARGLSYAGLILLMVVVPKGTEIPFIYFQF